jgi:hypothetical protein
MPAIATRSARSRNEISLTKFTVLIGQNKLMRTSGKFAGGVVESRSYKYGGIKNATNETATED